ncbi:hypothetical protein J6590_066090 [Homalodisca vitripennis]|nr:hypothetical protein J6590_066090 [Homalodisca vitripennis]
MVPKLTREALNTALFARYACEGSHSCSLRPDTGLARSLCDVHFDNPNKYLHISLF